MLTSNNKLFIKGDIDYNESLLILEHTSFPQLKSHPPPPPFASFHLGADTCLRVSLWLSARKLTYLGALTSCKSPRLKAYTS